MWADRPSREPSGKRRVAARSQGDLPPGIWVRYSGAPRGPAVARYPAWSQGAGHRDAAFGPRTGLHAESTELVWGDRSLVRSRFIGHSKVHGGSVNPEISWLNPPLLQRRL